MLSQNYAFQPYLASSLCDGGGTRNRSSRGTDGGVCDEPRRFFLRRAAAHFPLRAWFNSPYAYRVGVISLFITASFFFIAGSACLAASCLWLVFSCRIEVQSPQLQMANGCCGLLRLFIYISKPNGRMLPVCCSEIGWVALTLSLLSGFPAPFFGASILFFLMQHASSREAIKRLEMMGCQCRIRSTQ